MKKFGDIRDRMPPPCPLTGYDCGKKECDPANGKCGFPSDPPGRGYKVWGTTTPLIVTPMFEMHRLAVTPFMACSIHSHQCKHNAFFVNAGTLFLDVWEYENGPVAHHKLEAGAHFTIAPGAIHRFRTGQFPCDALEMYYTEPLSEDIKRRNVGGPV